MISTRSVLISLSLLLIAAPVATAQQIDGLRVGVSARELASTRAPQPWQPSRSEPSAMLGEYLQEQLAPDAGPVDSLLCWDCARAKQPFVAFWEMQLGMWPQWAVNKFLREGNLGDVNPAFWWRNIRGVWEWDPNSFDINQLGHPGQGSMYFNGWRSNGYGFWGSQLATLGGSLFWECCGERNLPSINDLLTTWIGGATLGEAGRRLSDMWLDNGTTGRERFWREASAFAVNPVRGLDRVFRGHAWRLGPNPTGIKPTWTQGVVGTGGVLLGSQRATDDGWRGGAKLATRFQYGRAEDIVGAPFNHFEIEAEFTSVPGAYLYLVRSRGSLFGKFLGGDSTRILTSFLRYDYIRSRAFQMGAQTITLALERRYDPRDGLRIWTEAALRLVPIAAIEDDFVVPFGENRNYDYTFGAGMSAGATARWRERGMLRWQSIYTAMRVADGAAESHIVFRHELYSQYQLSKVYGIGLGFRHQSRRTYTKNLGRSTARSPEVWLTLLRATPRWNF